MKFRMTCFLIGVILVSSCKKEESEPDFNGEYSGKIASINGQAWVFHYTEDGLLSEYKYSSPTANGTAKLMWETGQVTCDDGIGFTYLRPRNAGGFALPGGDDQQVGNSWTYDSQNQVTSMNSISYHWSNGNIDSLTFGSSLTTYEYLSSLDTRDYGARFVPKLTHFPIYNLNMKNLVKKSVQFDSNGDTLYTHLFTYSYDSKGRISSELKHQVMNGDTTYYSLYNYTYYE